MKRIGGLKESLVLLSAFFVVSFLVAAAGAQLPAEPSDPCTVTGNPDFDASGTVDFVDFSWLGRYWRQSEPLVDIAPGPLGDGVIAFADLAALTTQWLADTAPPVYIQWLGHASVKIWTDELVVYVDPRNLTASPHDATVVLVTHAHGDHFAPADIARVSSETTLFVAPPDVVASHGSGQVLAPGETLELPGVTITGVPAYNTNKPNHPRANNWLGYIVQIGPRRIYCAGDTDLTEEMKALAAIDVAFLPAGGTYTTTAREAAEATAFFQPRLAIPYHWGEIVGTLRDAQDFARYAACEVKVMERNEILSSDDWSREFSLLAHWRLDEAEGDVATDSVGAAHGALVGSPVWQPAAGAVGGALQLGGEDDHINAPGVVNPSDGPFSVLAWVSGGAPGQVILAQAEGANWLSADDDGHLLMELTGSGRKTVPLGSATTITDGAWHRVGLVWNGAERALYVDGAEVARDAQGNLIGSDAGLYIGANAYLDTGRFWSGLIDDVRIYRRALALP